MLEEMLSKDRDTSIKILLDEFTNEEAKPTHQKGGGRAKGTPKVPGSGRKKGVFNRETMARIDVLQDIRAKLYELVDARGIDDLMSKDVIKLLLEIEKFFRPTLSAVKQQTVHTMQIDLSGFTQKQLELLSSIPISESLPSVIETITLIEDATESDPEDSE